MPGDSELLVFDDSSVDGTAQALSEFGDHRLRVVTDDSVAGVADGLNALLRRSDSELVARMDADDVVLPLRFTRQQSALADGDDAVFSTVVDWYPDRKWIKPNPPLPIGVEAFPFHLLVTNPVSHPTMMARRSVLDAVGGYRQVPAEDYDLWLRLYLAGARQRRLAMPALLYRMHPTQVTASAGWRRASWASDVVSETFQDVSERILGRRFLRLTTLSSLESVSDAEYERQVTEFQSALERASSRLGRGERRLFLGKLRQRLESARRLRCSLGTS